MPQILLAYEGKLDFLKKTNPWGGGDDTAKGGAARVINEPLPTKAEVANTFRAWSSRRKGTVKKEP